MKDTKEKILETAVALMIDNGYNGVSIADITNKLDLARSLPYRYFKSKRDLFFEAFKQYFCERYIVRNFDYENISLKKFIDTILVRLCDIIQNLSSVSGKEISIFDYNALYFEALKCEPRFQRYMEESIFIVNPVLRNAVKSGEIKSDIPVEIIGRAFLDIMCRCANIERKLSTRENLDLICSDIYALYNMISVKNTDIDSLIPDESDREKCLTSTSEYANLTTM